MTYNKLMLLSCKELTLFQHTSRLCLWHMGRQKSHHIPQKCLKSCISVPVHKSTFPAEFNSILQNRHSFRPYGWTGRLKKSKSNGFVNLLSNVFLNAFSCVVTVSAVPSAFLAPTRAFKSLADCMP